jgi:hypothetical protein
VTSPKINIDNNKLNTGCTYHDNILLNKYDTGGIKKVTAINKAELTKPWANIKKKIAA